jgi:hypothetical protein
MVSLLVPEPEYFRSGIRKLYAHMLVIPLQLNNSNHVSYQIKVKYSEPLVYKCLVFPFFLYIPLTPKN